MENILKQLGQTIKKARQATGFTQDELGERADVTGRYIMALKNENKRPSFDVLCKIILALNIPAGSIFYPENEYTENQKEQLGRMLSQCDERDLKVITATIKALLESK
ncbi:MAG: helix-turn-helix transcriptional regulator [Oscillospiraceae bacterium]